MRNFTARTLATAAGILVAAATHSHAQTVSPAVERQLLAVRDSIWKGWYGNNTAVLDALLPKAVSTAHSGGGPALSWSDRAQVIDGSREFASSGGRLVSVAFRNTVISLRGNVAVMTAEYTTVTREGSGNVTRNGVATEVFVREGGKWVNPFWHLEERGQ